MPIGPKLDPFGRPPIPVEELNKFRVSREHTLKPQRFESFLRKGDGHKHLIKINKKYESGNYTDWSGAPPPPPEI